MGGGSKGACEKLLSGASTDSVPADELEFGSPASGFAVTLLINFSVLSLVVHEFRATRFSGVCG
jgi:hypothetical protein